MKGGENVEDVSNVVNALWAKKKIQDGIPRWLPLIIHLNDTENAIGWLYNHWLNDGQRKILSEGFDSEDELLKFVKFLGFIHDIGKATPAFQTKASYDRDEELDDYLVKRLVDVGMVGLESADLPSRKHSPHNRAGEALLSDWGVSEEICAIIGGHHGKPFSGPQSEQLKDYTANYFQKDNDSKIQEKWHCVQKAILQRGLDSLGYDSISELPQNISQPQSVLFEGLLIMADWLSSSESLDDGRPLFPLINLEKSAEDVDIQSRYQTAINNWNQDDSVVFKPVFDISSNYEKRWGFKPRNVQKVMSDAIGKIVDPGIIIIEAPMGIGKTEIALTASEQLAYASGRDGIYIGLPTQATTNAMFNRVNDWLKNIADEEHEKLSIKLMHGKAMFNQTYRSLPHAENIDNDGADGSVTVNGWFSGKKSILTKFTVGTIDNLLLMGLKQKHLFLKHLGFSGKVVIIDEAHAYDAYMNSYLCSVIRWLGAYHVPLIILSATLPKKKRQEWIATYLEGKYHKDKIWKSKVSFPQGWESEESYPLLSYLDGDMVKQITDFGVPDSSQKKKIKVFRFNADNEETIKNVVEKIKDGGIAGVIVNTVRRAQELVKLVPDDIELMVLHSAFLAPDRTLKEEKLQDAIGKNGNRPKKMIVIGTQVLEQSLDIDFDVLYTDIAPMDLILQRIGRLHRHEINRPQNLSIPQVNIMEINGMGDYGDANEKIYGKYLLMKTDYYLKDEINIPEDISHLVQSVYTDDDIIDDDNLREAKQISDIMIAKEEKKAKNFQIGKPKYSRRNNTIHGWLDRDIKNLSENDQSACAAVRDIDETIEVILIKSGQDEDELLDGRSISDVSSKEVAEQLIRVPSAVIPEYDIEKVIRELEESTRINYPEWENDIWLKGSLAIVLDENLETNLNGWHLKYSREYGLSYERNGVD